MNENIKMLKKVELNILDKFIEICKENNLVYYLAYGSLLGAIRHQGFIPWDDDIDIFMPAEDLLKFKKIILKSKSSKYYFQDKTTDKYYYNYWAKFGLEGTTWMPKNRLVNCKYGICIDIFPIFYINNTKKNKIERYYKILKVGASKYYVLNQKEEEYSKFKKILQRLLPNTVSKLLYKASYNKMCSLNKNPDTIIILGAKVDEYKYFDKGVFSNGKKMLFENRKVNVPKDPIPVLKKLYGDFMKIPPVEKRYGHDLDNNSIIYDFNKSYLEYMEDKK